MTPSYVPLEAIQLLSETFMLKMLSLKNYPGAFFKIGHPVYIYIQSDSK